MGSAVRVAWVIGGVVAAGGCGTIGDSPGGPSSLSSITASGAVMGQQGHIRVAFSNPVGHATDVMLSSASPGTATVPDHVTVEAGAVSADIAYSAVVPGIAVFRATAGDDTQSTTATIVDSLHVNAGGGATFEVGAHGIISQAVNINVPEAITLALASSQSDIATIDAELTIPAFRSSGLAQIIALAPGASVMNASYNGQLSSQTVTVVDKARIVEVFGTNLFEVGGRGTAQVSLNAQLATATSLTITPSDPSVVNVPKSYPIAAGSTFASFDMQGMAIGTSNVVFSLNGSSGTLPIAVLGKAQLENVFMNGTPSVGDSTQISINMNAVAASAHDVVLTSSDPAVVSVPAMVTVFAGTSGTNVSITPLKAGSAVITASYNGISRQLPVIVGTSGYALNLYGQSRYVVGTVGELSLQTGSSVPSTVSLVSSDPNVVSVPPSIVVRQSETAPLTMAHAGSATITASINGTSTTFPITVVTTARLQQFGPSFSVPIDGALSTNLFLDTQPPAGSVITFTTSDASVAPAPPSIALTNGQTYIPFVIRGGTSGTATISASFAGVVSSAVVYVGGSTAGGGTFTGLGVNGTSTVELGGAVALNANFFPAPPNGDTGTITFGTPGILTTPSTSLAIAANTCCNYFPVLAAVAGTTDVTVNVGGVSQSATIKVVPAASYSLQVPGTVKAGASVTADLSADAALAANRAVTLTSSNPNVATVSAPSITIGPGDNNGHATFGVKGVAAGTATITATVRGTAYTATVTVQ